MKCFAKIDIKSAYNQIEIDEKFKEITKINTLIGLLRGTRLPFSVLKLRATFFQRAVEKVLFEEVKI